MRWLVVSPYLPHPRIGHGGGTAVLQLCRALALEHETRLLCFRREREAGLEADLVADGVTVDTVGFRSDQAQGTERLGLIADRTRHWLRARGDDLPLMVAKYDRVDMHRRLRETIQRWRPDVVQVEYGFMAGYAATARATGGPHVLLNTHELASLVRLRRTARAPGTGPRRAEAAELRRWAAHERAYVAHADTILCVTEQDRVVLEAMTGATNLVTVPLGTDVANLAPTEPERSPGPPRLLFVGSFGHPPNVEAVRVLCDTVLPAVRAREPDAVLEIVGADPPAWLRERGTDGLVVHGFVDDLDAVYARAAVVVAPLVSGGGIKIKILEAMGRGAAVVTTPIGAEGIDENGDALVVVRSIDDFAPHVLGLLEDPARRGELGRRARTWIEERFAWPAIVGRLTGLVQSSSQARQGGTGRSEP